jgi:hypothetical protein
VRGSDPPIRIGFSAASPKLLCPGKKENAKQTAKMRMVSRDPFFIFMPSCE